MIQIRQMLWHKILKISGQPEGERLYWFLMVARWLMYPLDTFYWKMRASRGYQPIDDTWIIEGVIFHRSDIDGFKRIMSIK